MLNVVWGIIVAIFALLGAGVFSYTYLEHTVGPRDSTPAVVQVSPKVATTTCAQGTRFGLNVHEIPQAAHRQAGKYRGRVQRTFL